MADHQEKNAETLLKLRVPFEPNQFGKKPAPNKRQTEEVTNGTVKAAFCDECKGYHHPKAQHLDYVGHAALTHRLLDVDPFWNWEPMALGQNGLPAIDADGGLWIRLTVAGMTRLGYGDAGQKKGPEAMKERIGDALRNAGMRFGMALELWHKGVLEMEPERFEPSPADKWVMKAGAAASVEDLQKVWQEGAAEISEKGDRAAYDEFKASVSARKKELEPQKSGGAA